jgi:hypothetical protein
MTIEYAMTQTRILPSGTVYGECAKVYVNGIERFSIAVPDKYDHICHVIMFTRIKTDGVKVASFGMLPSTMDVNLREMATVFARF